MTNQEDHTVERLSLADHPDRESVVAWAIAEGIGDLHSVGDERSLWTDELASLPADIRAELPEEPGWQWAVYPWLRSATLVPDEATMRAVLTSRNYPIVSRHEQAKLAAGHVVVVGLSTGRAVAQQLVRLGVGSIHLVDGDHLAPSNTNRLVGTRLTDMGMPKVVSTARELLEYNPYLGVSTQIAFLDSESLTEHLAEKPATVIVEMIDGLPAKVAIRRVARANNIPVVMPTDMDWDPMVDIDYPDAPMFGGRLDDDDIAAVEDPTTSFAEKTEIAMRFMALPKWAPRSFLSGQLARNGLVSYWSQTAPSVAVGGAMVARAVFDIFRGKRGPGNRAVLSVRDVMGTDDPIDKTEPLYLQLVEVAGEVEVPS